MGVFADSRLEFGRADGYAGDLGGQSAIRRPVDENSAALAQLVEHRIRNAGVVGSNPIGGTITFSRKFWFPLAKGRKTKCSPTYYFVSVQQPIRWR
jgi:hypothetical protein